MTLLISILAYFTVAAVVGALGTRMPRFGNAVAALPYALQLLVVGFLWADRTSAGGASFEWIPSLGVAIEVVANPLSLILTTVVAGIGLMISIYSAAYFSEPRDRFRFLGYMLVFSGGMAGIVASNNLFGLFVFWEITTVASYLLIGFNRDQASARAAALQAILVTTAGGLAMLGGFVLLTIEAGTSSISTIVARPPIGTAVNVALVLIFIGAFTKSAQVPFHFWLPGAMAAPTPASAYLHSATMVKAGIVLLLLLFPGFSSTSLWVGAVTTVGLTTMVVGAIGALRRNDLKLLLAHGTVSQLGFIVALIGLGHNGAALAMLVAHAVFKAALFLVVGIVDKTTSTRDIRELAGLGRQRPILAAIAGVAALSMAGAPPFLGFVSKEAALDVLIASGDWISLSIIAAASVLTVVYSARFWFGAFSTKAPNERVTTSAIHPGLWIGPVVLAIATVLFGLFPARIGEAVSEAAGSALKLVLWPGLKPALAISSGILVTGAFLYSAWPRLEHLSLKISPSGRLSLGDRAYRGALRALNLAADRTTGLVQNGSLPIYLAVILTAVFIVPTVAWLGNPPEGGSLQITNGATEVALAGVAIAGAVAAAVAQRRMASALLLGVVGYAIAGVYVVFSAPDLALTQILIETLTIALFALVLVRLPRRYGTGPRSLSHRTRLLISGLAGVFVTATAVVAGSVDHDRTIADRYVELAADNGGRNVVNVVLTNFRAIDTLGEITVLAAAAVGIGILIRNVSTSSPEEQQ